MGILEDYMEIRQRLDRSIEVALGTVVADGLRESIQRSAEKNVYSYSPMFESRRKEEGGIVDPSNMPISVSGLELTLTNTTGLQNLYGGDDDSPLVPIVEEGVEAYHMPYPRSFMEEGRDDYVESGDAGADIASFLRAAGFEVI